MGQQARLAEFNLRFPGQYLDRETGLHYNYFRDYDPQTGRYVQSDPIGVRGGLNTYLYALARPISLSDPLGLEALKDRAIGEAIKRFLEELLKSPGIVEGYRCANTTDCGYFNRFPDSALYDGCKHLIQQDPTRKWFNECYNTCFELLRKRCVPPSACRPIGNDAG